ncbi:MAG: hypothetical protein GXO99_04095 [Nitrospirae bacterium]|nr:hypothetical protein [Nitrospirota bacterium]
MGVYRYEELKKAARQARAEIARGRGIAVEKGIRKKPRSPEKRELLFQRAVERLRRYPPLKTEQGIVLPYFTEHLRRI